MTGRPTKEDALAVAGVGGTPPALSTALADAVIRWPLALLAGVGAVVPLGTFLAVAPMLAAERGVVASTADDTVLALLIVAMIVAPVLGLAATARRHLRRGLLVLACVLSATGLALVATGAPLVLGGSVSGAGLGLGAPLAVVLVSDGVPPGGRLRVLTAALAAGMATPVLGLLVTSDPAPALVAGIVVALLGAGAAALQPFPLPGAVDEVQIRALVLGDGDDVAGPELEVRDLVRRLWARPTVRWVLWPVSVAGASLVALPIMSWFLSGRPVDDRAWGAAVAGVIALVVGLAGAFRSDATFAASPRRALGRVRWWLLAAAAAGVVAGVAQTAELATLAAGSIGGASAILLGRTFASLAVAVPARGRALAAALVLHTLTLGGVLALSVGAGIDRRFGPGWAVGLLAAAVGLAELVVIVAARHLPDDIDRTVGRILDTQRIVARRNAGDHVPLLSCSGIDFAYGQVQVLFDVDFTVDDGEMVALLGTNGAGKSTLLRVISGLGLPRAGNVRYDGRDITFWRPTQRVDAGITQIPGGKAVFGPMSVVENLRVYGYALGRDRAAVDRGIEEALGAFPRLHERRNLPAQVLSGGEQQMLALSKALILQPRLLCIDELSLGLAPKIVSELLEMVRRINARGTAVVLVEQSVNVALSLVDHAYYMEKGEIRFDGAATELLERPDILRSVYLQGAAKGLQS